MYVPKIARERIQWAATWGRVSPEFIGTFLLVFGDCATAVAQLGIGFLGRCARLGPTVRTQAGWPGCAMRRPGEGRGLMFQLKPRVSLTAAGNLRPGRTT